MIRSLLRSSLLVALAAASSAQTFIVDANNGPGTHFLDIAPAVAAVPDGATLRVRAGSYSSFAVANKSLTILGDSNATVQVAGFTVGPLATANRVVVKDVRIQPLSYVRVADAQGHVLLDSISMSGDLLLPASWFTIQNSADVHLQGFVGAGYEPVDVSISRSHVEISRCSFTGRKQLTAGAIGFPAVRADDSRVAVFGSTLTGGNGGTDLAYSFGSGGAGIEAVSSEVDLGPGNVLAGGQGGIDPAGFGCYYVMAPGGPGLRLSASRARVSGTTLRGGPGPCFVCFTQPCTTFGPSVIIDAASSYTALAGTAPATRVQGVPRLNSYVDVVLNAGPDQVALLAFGFTPAFVAWPDIIDFGGILTLPEIVFGPFVTSSTGTTSYRLQLPSTFVLDRVVWAQYFTFPGLVLPGMGSNSVSIVVKS